MILMIEVEHEADPDHLDRLAEYLDYLDSIAAMDARYLAHELRQNSLPEGNAMVTATS